MADHLLELDDLTMRFGGVTALDSVSLQLDQGEILGLIGPNGAGKTTVFNCLTGFYRPSIGRLQLKRGKHEFLLERMDGFRIAREAGVARTFQNIRMFAGMTVLENLVRRRTQAALAGFHWPNPRPSAASLARSGAGSSERSPNRLANSASLSTMCGRPTASA